MTTRTSLQGISRTLRGTRSTPRQASHAPDMFDDGRAVFAVVGGDVLVGLPR